MSINTRNHQQYSKWNCLCNNDPGFSHCKCPSWPGAFFIKYLQRTSICPLLSQNVTFCVQTDSERVLKVDFNNHLVDCQFDRHLSCFSPRNSCLKLKPTHNLLEICNTLFEIEWLPMHRPRKRFDQSRICLVCMCSVGKVLWWVWLSLIAEHDLGQWSDWVQLDSIRPSSLCHAIVMLNLSF